MWKKISRKKTNRKIEEKIFEEYFWNKRTLRELTEIFSLNRKTIQKYIHEYEVRITKKKPRTINLIVDVIFFSKRKFHTEFGIMVFYDSLQEEVIVWKEVTTEKLSDYKEMYFQLLREGFVVQSVVIDGKKAYRAFLLQKRYLFNTVTSIKFKLFYDTLHEDQNSVHHNNLKELLNV